MLLLATLLSFIGGAQASSHREAPAIALDPAADISDFYMFLSPQNADNLVIILNVNPFEIPGAGPNYYRFDDEVLYEINIDTNGDARPDTQFQFRFTTDHQWPDTFLYNVGEIADASRLNTVQTYKVMRIDRAGRATGGARETLFSDGRVAPVNVGVKSADAIHYNAEATLPGSITEDHIKVHEDLRFFAGPRQESSFADLERSFDLLNTDHEDNINTLLGYNVHTIAVEVPLDQVMGESGTAGSGTAGSGTAESEIRVIAAWASTYRQRMTVYAADGTRRTEGDWVQVSRVGNPLVNSILMPIEAKDRYNAGKPGDDMPYVEFVRNAALFEYLGQMKDLECDIEAGRGTADVLFLGMQEVSDAHPQRVAAGTKAYDALRLDVSGKGLGAWPDGRKPQDDVVDSMLSLLCGHATTGKLLTDGVDATGISFLESFPYLGDPWAGDRHPAQFHGLDTEDEPNVDLIDVVGKQPEEGAEPREREEAGPERGY